jgi:selenium-binding protein 1
MKRREFLTSTALTAHPLLTGSWTLAAGDAPAEERTFATPANARKSPPEKLAYVVATYVGTGVGKPDYLATIDVDPRSKTYSQVIHRLRMPNVGDELHHFGWNACASCYGRRARRYLIVPGLGSGRLHVIDTATPAEPKMHKVIEPKEVVTKTNLTVPHTVHCLVRRALGGRPRGDELQL